MSWNIWPIHQYSCLADGEPQQFHIKMVHMRLGSTGPWRHKQVSQSSETNRVSTLLLCDLFPAHTCNFMGSFIRSVDEEKARAWFAYSFGRQAGTSHKWTAVSTVPFWYILRDSCEGKLFQWEELEIVQLINELGTINDYNWNNSDLWAVDNNLIG